MLLTSVGGAVRSCTVDVLVDATGPGRALLRQAGVAVDSGPLLTGEGVEWLLQGTPGTRRGGGIASAMWAATGFPMVMAGCS